jgi:membrane fusion protein, multidrug efflux system
MKMKKKTILIAVVIVIIAAIGIKLVINKSKIDKNNQTRQTVTTTVTVKPVINKEQNSALQLTGVTAAKQEVTLKAETAGQITAINFNLGEFAPKGKVLVEIDSKLAELNLESAQLNLSKLEDEYNKTKNLYSGKATSETKVRDAKLDYERAKITVEQVKKQLGYTKITATQNGNIVSKLVEKGSYVSPGTPILNLVDISQLKVTINVAEKEVYNMKPGQNVKIFSSVYPTVVYDGKVSFVSQQGDKAHNYPIEITLNNKPSYQLKAGTFVSVDFSFASGKAKLLIPRESLVGSIKNAKVYVVNNDNTVHQHSVVIGRDLGNYLEVLSGLNEGDKVVTTGQINLSDGITVSIIN